MQNGGTPSPQPCWDHEHAQLGAWPGAPAARTPGLFALPGGFPGSTGIHSRSTSLPEARGSRHPGTLHAPSHLSSSTNPCKPLVLCADRGRSARGVQPAGDRDDSGECACVQSCPLPCCVPPNMSMLSAAWSTATPGGRLLARPGAHKLILAMTCRLSCCCHIGPEEGGGRRGPGRSRQGRGCV